MRQCICNDIIDTLNVLGVEVVGLRLHLLNLGFGFCRNLEKGQGVMIKQSAKTPQNQSPTA